MTVDLVDHMGSDLSVVNAARVSFDKESKEMGLGDERLIKYLAKHNHWTPFGHATASFRIKAPLFVARQLGKHQVGLVWNEVSRRYVDSSPEMYTPDSWRKRAENVKQGSSEETVEFIDREIRVGWLYERHKKDCYTMYEKLLEAGVCPEQARMVLPQSMMTEWIWTGSLIAFARVVNLRIDPHTQLETRVIGHSISCYMRELFPVCWKELVDGKA